MPIDTFLKRINPWLVSLGVALFMLFIAAGIWQVRRAHYKEALQSEMAHAALEPPILVTGANANVKDLDFHKLAAKGVWIADKTVFIDNKVSNGIVGYYVVTPLRVENSQLCVLVNRGWVAAPSSRKELPQIDTPATLVEVGGIARIPTERFLELSAQTVDGRVWQNLTAARFQAWSGLALLPVVIYQETSAESGLVGVTPAPEASGLGADRHWGYAFMWFSLAVLTVILIVVTALKAAKQNERNEPN